MSNGLNGSSLSVSFVFDQHESQLEQFVICFNQQSPLSTLKYWFVEYLFILLYVIFTKTPIKSEIEVHKAFIQSLKLIPSCINSLHKCCNSLVVNLKWSQHLYIWIRLSKKVRDIRKKYNLNFVVEEIHFESNNLTLILIMGLVGWFATATYWWCYLLQNGTTGTWRTTLSNSLDWHVIACFGFITACVVW